MPNVLVRNIDERTLNNLKKTAERNNRSLQAELKSILETYGKVNVEETRNMVREELRKYRAEGRMFSDSVEDLREIRDHE
jgi:plasmid stability protein